MYRLSLKSGGPEIIMPAAKSKTVTKKVDPLKGLERRLQKLERQQKDLKEILEEVAELQGAMTREAGQIHQTLKGLDNQVTALMNRFDPGQSPRSHSIPSGIGLMQERGATGINANARAAVGQQRRQPKP
jgi:hypothetical protein